MPFTNYVIPKELHTLQLCRSSKRLSKKQKTMLPDLRKLFGRQKRVQAKRSLRYRNADLPGNVIALSLSRCVKLL